VAGPGVEMKRSPTGRARVTTAPPTATTEPASPARAVARVWGGALHACAQVLVSLH
jgi:hypothetical protein